VVARLVLVRHGLSAHTRTGVVDRDGVRRWRDAYDIAGIIPQPGPPPALTALAARATHLIASDLPRAVQSAKLLAPEREIRIEPLMREAPLSIPRWPTRLPLSVWGVIMYAGWSYRRLRGIDVTGPDFARGEVAARWLADIVSDGTTALVVTHGVFRKLIATHLVRLGWSEAGRAGGFRHWSAWSFVDGERPPNA
jgi:broad specificity phosphatase PhoE